MSPRRAGSLVVFGISGDLAKKLVLPALYRLEERGALDEPIIGVARSAWSEGDLRDYAHDAVMGALGGVDKKVFDRLAERLSYVAGEYDDSTTFDELKARLGARARSAVYYLAVPPPVFSIVATALAREGLNKDSRLVVEKPFGHDLASARALYAELALSFSDEQIFRVDHFLGKESVEDIFVFRFANSLFEPVWNRFNVQSVQLSFAETLDVADRGAFYDDVGAIRDVVQNHLFQVLAHIAMDAPSGSDPDAEQLERTRLLRAVRTLSERDLVRGQYEGYRKVEGVDPKSLTDTFVAMKLAIDSPRWHGVPFYIRTGKCLPVTALEAVVELKPAPSLPQLSTGGGGPSSNLVRLRLQPDAGITCEVLAKAPGPKYGTRSVSLCVDFDQALGPSQLAYERVLSDALAGTQAHFTSQEAVEESWRIVDRILEPSAQPVIYKPGSWGPAESDKLPGRSGWVPLAAEVPSEGSGTG